MELKPISKIGDMRHLELCLIFPVVPELYRLGQYMQKNACRVSFSHSQELKPISKIGDMRHLELCLIFPVVPELYRLGQYPPPSIKKNNEKSKFASKPLQNHTALSPKIRSCQTYLPMYLSHSLVNTTISPPCCLSPFNSGIGRF
eukprot:sb/3473905/